MLGNDTIEIGTDRQLFVDEYVIAEQKGTERRLHSPVRREVAIAVDHPWEACNIVSCASVILDGDRYRMWYRCDSEIGRNPKFTAYAESKDGITWVKPSQGLFEFEGSKDNNLVWVGEPGEDLAPFRDDNPDASDDERYKAIARIRDDDVIVALASADGFHWRLMREEPILTEGPFDTRNTPFWDPRRGEYAIYTRGVGGMGTGSGDLVYGRAEGFSHDAEKGGVRWIRRATSKDFINWTPLEDIDCGDTPYEHLYTNACIPYDRAPGIYLAFPFRFVPDRTPTPGWESPGVADVVFMSSRDGLHFDRSFMEAFVRPGLDPDTWHERALGMEWGILHTAPGEMSMYGQENVRLPTNHIRRFELRTDGFVSVNAGYGGGEFTTKPFTFEGNELELNYSTSAVGSVRVEIQDAEGRPQPGFTLDDCPEMFADKIEGKVAWEGGGDVSVNAGKPVRLRFTLMDADLYAFKFNE